ncbi:MAG TPA: hypothetical protein VK507_19205 [Iamia sp.]|nr:hypothetical protein [Iamia sp.]
MGCGCGGGGRTARAGRGIRTSGDLVVEGMTGPEHRGTPVGEPLAVLPDGVEEIPEGAKYRVVLDGQVAYFADHGSAFSYQQANPGKLRTV